ncbi:MAG: AAA family ATPase [Planctomycetales bacterium]|nr:AAA family ATPase [Planctomycetales bacterium]
MYEAYWSLDQKPFDTTSSSDFYYPGESHQGALLKLRYAIENRRGAAVLAGAAGLGKSLLIDALFRQLPANYNPRVHLVFPQLKSEQLLAFLAEELAGTLSEFGGSASPEVNVRRIRDTLSDVTQAGHHTVVVIDEAHLLDELDAFETVRLLLNFSTDNQSDLTIVLVGQPQILAALDRTPALEERVGVKCLLRPFSEEETASYVTHRLTAAGATQSIFADSALSTVHALSHGVPRRINRLCDLALLVGFAEERTSISAEQIESVADEMISVSPD